MTMNDRIQFEKKSRMETLDYIGALLTDLSNTLTPEAIEALKISYYSGWNVSTAHTVFQTRSILSVLLIHLDDLAAFARANSGNGSSRKEPRIKADRDLNPLEKLQRIGQLMTDLTVTFGMETIAELKAIEGTDWNTSSAGALFHAQHILSVLSVYLSDLMELARLNSAACAETEDVEETDVIEKDRPDSSKEDAPQTYETETLPSIRQLVSDLTDVLSPEAVEDLESIDHPEWNIGSVCAVHYARSFVTVLSKHLNELEVRTGVPAESRDAAKRQPLTEGSTQTIQSAETAGALPFADTVGASSRAPQALVLPLTMQGPA